MSPGETIRPADGSTTAKVVVLGVVLVSTLSCASQGTAVAKPQFDHVPTSCVAALNPARSEIDQFADGLGKDTDKISTDADPGFYEGSIGVRCAAIFTRGPDAAGLLDDSSMRSTSRHLFVSFAVIRSSDTVTGPVERTRELFDQRRRISDAAELAGIGDAAYTVITRSRYPGGIAGTIAASVEIRFRISNLIVKADVGGINVHDSAEPAQLLADLARDADAIAKALAADIDTVMT